MYFVIFCNFQVWFRLLVGIICWFICLFQVWPPKLITLLVYSNKARITQVMTMSLCPFLCFYHPNHFTTCDVLSTSLIPVFTSSVHHSLLCTGFTFFPRSLVLPSFNSLQWLCKTFELVCLCTYIRTSK